MSEDYDEDYLDRLGVSDEIKNILTEDVDSEEEFPPEVWQHLIYEAVQKKVSEYLKKEMPRLIKDYRKKGKINTVEFLVLKHTSGIEGVKEKSLEETADIMYRFRQTEYKLNVNEVHEIRQRILRKLKKELTLQVIYDCIVGF